MTALADIYKNEKIFDVSPDIRFLSLFNFFGIQSEEYIVKDIIVMNTYLVCEMKENICNNLHLYEKLTSIIEEWLHC